MIALFEGIDINTGSKLECSKNEMTYGNKALHGILMAVISMLGNTQILLNVSTSHLFFGKIENSYLYAYGHS